MDVEAQIADLTRRVSALEKAEKGHECHNARVIVSLIELKEDVSLLRWHAILTGQNVEEIEARLSAVEAGLEGVRADVASLRRDLSGIIAVAMCKVLREGR